MDTDRQLHELEARGWQRGLYEDIQETFRAPIVNWIFRTTMENEPAFLRYAWGQVKPIFETRAFARLSVRYRDAVLSSLEGEGNGDGDGEGEDEGEGEEEHALPTYRPRDVDLSPPAYRELRGQLATYDVVAPRLAVLFETMDRALHGGPPSVGRDPADGRAATAPYPDWLDRDRGLAPTLLDVADVAGDLEATVDAIQSFHGFDDGLPSIYRTLAQWPPFLQRMWTDLEPHLAADSFGIARTRTDDLVGTFVDTTPYRPRLAPEDLAEAGFDRETVESLQGLFGTFNSGPVETVLPALPVFAATVDAAGERDAL